MELIRIVSVITFCLLVAMVTVECFMKCDCKRRKCKPALNCNVGTHKDMCGCCDICAKDEGELCGGLNHVAGECGHKLQCMVRRIADRRNRGKNNVSELVGRCEYVPCHYKRCSFGQVCTLRNNTPTCSCPACKEMSTKPVCGEHNNKDYKNECELRTQECLVGKEIGMISGKCKPKNTTRIECREDSMRIEILKDYIAHVKNKKLTLLDNDCVFKQNSTHFFIETKLQECSTKANFALTSVIYSNIIQTEVSPNTLIVRRRNSVQIPVECFYSLRSKSSNDVSIAARGKFGDRIEEKLRGNGFGIKVVDDGNRNSRSVNGNEIKVDFDHTEKYLVELRVNALKATSSALLLPRYCYVTPVEHKERWMRYSLIEDGCPIENGVEVLKSKTPIIKLTVPGIHFEGTKRPGFLVRCKIRACFPRDPNNTKICYRNCLNKRKRSRRDLIENGQKLRDLLLDFEVHGTPIQVPQ